MPSRAYHSAAITPPISLDLNRAAWPVSQRNDFLRQVHPDDRASFKAHIRELRPGNPSYALSFRFVRPDGRQVWLEETAKGEFDATGRLLRIKGLTRDITERKHLEEHKNLLIAELDHRVKNALAIVSVIASARRRRAARWPTSSPRSTAASNRWQPRMSC